MTTCQNAIVDDASYWLAGQRKMVRCRKEATTRIYINPPKPGNDGTVAVCDFCAEWDYQLFQKRERLETRETET